MPPLVEAQDMEAAVAAVSEMHPAPGVLAKASVLLRDEGVALPPIAELIALDPALMADVMRVSNSVAFGFSTQATNVQEAISRLGYKEVLRLLAMCVSKQLASQGLPHYGLSALENWGQAVSVAIMVEALAKRVGESVHDAYTVGMLHWVGRLVVESLLCEGAPTPPVAPGQDPVDWEREHVGVDFAQAGYALLRHWRFSSLICQPVRQQLDSPKHSRSTHMLDSLRFAREVVQISGIGFLQNFLVSETQPYVSGYMLAQEELDQMLSESREQFFIHQELLGMHA